jgi:hypothetical protein
MPLGSGFQDRVSGRSPQGGWLLGWVVGVGSWLKLVRRISSQHKNNASAGVVLLLLQYAHTRHSGALVAVAFFPPFFFTACWINAWLLPCTTLYCTSGRSRLVSSGLQPICQLSGCVLWYQILCSNCKPGRQKIRYGRCHMPRERTVPLHKHD